MAIGSSAYSSMVAIGLGHFHEAHFASFGDALRGRLDRWGDWHARRDRYEVFWAHYEGNVYRRGVRHFAEGLKDAYGLYSHIRSIRSPAYRIGEFWAGKVMPGALDPAAGDGTARASALPIIIPASTPPDKAEALRACIARIWRESVWQVMKSVWTRHGAVLGDVGLMVVDDPANRRVYFKSVHPRTIVELPRDDRGNVRGYSLQDMRPDPEAPVVPGQMAPLAAYQETATRVGSSVYYQTFRDGVPYDWGGPGGDGPPRTEWTEDYGFVPFVFVPHRDMGLGWGWSELHPSLPRLHEVDDQASKLCDQVRKCVDARFLFAGVRPEDLAANRELAAGAGYDADDEDDRDTIEDLYVPEPRAQAQPLVAPLDLAAAQANIQALLDGIDAQHPELLIDMVGPQASGESRRLAKEKVEAMVAERRPVYDDALVRAHMMAISIGAMRGYPGYEAFSAESYAAEELVHAIGDRPVFAVDELDRIAVADARFAAAGKAVLIGVPLAEAARLVGFPAEQVDAIEAAVAAEKAAAPAPAPPPALATVTKLDAGAKEVAAIVAEG
jgi:hypothetical protein